MLRPLDETDLELILLWRNAPAVRRTMFTQNEIGWEEHRAWFTRMQADERKQWFLYLNQENQKSGVVYFTDINKKQGTAFWGFYASPIATPGTGMRMSLDALDYAFNELCLNKLNAEVLASNPRVVEMYKKTGLIEEGCFRENFFDGEELVDVIRLGMLAKEWEVKRTTLAARIAKLDALSARKNASPTPLYHYSIVILSDANSWLNPSVHDLMMDWCERGHQVQWFHSIKDLPAADFCFCLSFGQLLPNKQRQQFTHTLVVHESDLPQGKGWSPLSWQVLEGKSCIPVSLFEAADTVDSGPIYAQRWMEFKGHELVDELRQAQANATQELCKWFIDHYPESLDKAREQQGQESFYTRRRPEDSQLDPEKTIAEQFNLLRVVDNERYPAFFECKSRRFYLRIF